MIASTRCCFIYFLLQSRYIIKLSLTSDVIFRRKQNISPHQPSREEDHHHILYRTRIRTVKSFTFVGRMLILTHIKARKSFQIFLNNFFAGFFIFFSRFNSSEAVESRRRRVDGTGCFSFFEKVEIKVVLIFDYFESRKVHSQTVSLLASLPNRNMERVRSTWRLASHIHVVGLIKCISRNLARNRNAHFSFSLYIDATILRFKCQHELRTRGVE